MTYPDALNADTAGDETSPPLELEPHAYHANPLYADACYYCLRPANEHADYLPAGAEPDDDPDALAAELTTEYAAAVERVRDRAQEARAGGRYMRRHAFVGLSAPVSQLDLAQLVRRDRRDRHNWTAARQGDERLGVPLRDTPVVRLARRQAELAGHAF